MRRSGRCWRRWPGRCPSAEGLVIALQSLRRGLQADEVALITQPAGQPAPLARLRRPARHRPVVGHPAHARHGRDRAGQHARPTAWPGNCPAAAGTGCGRWRFRQRAGGPTVLLASWRRVPPTKEETALLEDAAHSLRLALEREEAAHAHQEAAALRRSRELQRGVPVPAEPRAAHPADRHHGATRPASAAGRDLGRASPSSGSWPGSPPSRPASAAWSMTCSTSPRSSRASCGCSATGATSGWCSRRRSPACRRSSAASVALTLRRRPARGVGRPRPAGAGLRQPAEQRVRPQPAGHPGPGDGHHRCRGGDQRAATTGVGMPPELVAAPFEPARRPRARPRRAAAAARPAAASARRGPRPVHRQGDRAGARRPARARPRCRRAPASRSTCRSRPRSSSRPGSPSGRPPETTRERIAHDDARTAARPAPWWSRTTPTSST